MERRSVEAIVRALNDAGVRYMIVGGLAVVAHGFLRFTADLDLVLEMGPENVRKAIGALASLGFRPRAPVELDRFADPSERALWLREKGLVVFSLASREHPATEVDLFVEAPFDFERASADTERMEIAPGLTAVFVGLRDLIEMKRKAARPQDLDDVEHLMNPGGRPKGES